MLSTAKTDTEKNQIKSAIDILQSRLNEFRTGMATVIGARGGNTDFVNAETARNITVDFNQKITADGKIIVSLEDSTKAAQEILKGPMDDLTNAIKERTKLDDQYKKDMEAKIAALESAIKRNGDPIQKPLPAQAKPGDFVAPEDYIPAGTL